jgi:hypothetical protein
MPATKAQVLIKELVIHHEGIRSLSSKLCSVSPSGTSSRIQPRPFLQSTFAPSNAPAAAPTINRRICDWSHWEQDRIPLPDQHGGRSSPAGSGPVCPIATGAYCFHGLGSAGISMDVPSGSIRKSGGEPGKGAGGPSSTKHAICKSREGRLAPSEEINVTPARSRVITEIAPPRLSPNSDLGASAILHSRGTSARTFRYLIRTQ